MQINDVGAQLLINALQNNYSLLTLNLMDNMISADNMQQINALLLRNIPTTSTTTLTTTSTSTSTSTQTPTTTATTSTTITSSTSSSITTTPLPTTISTSSSTTSNLTTTLQPNHPPIVMHPMANQTITVDDPFELQISNNTFVDPDGDALRLTLTTQNGEMLPSWLLFNKSNLVLSGTPNQTEMNHFRLTAEDPSNATASIDFQLHVLPKTTTLSPMPSSTITVTDSSTTPSSSTIIQPMATSSIVANVVSASTSTGAQTGLWAGVGAAAAVGGLITAVGMGLFCRHRRQQELNVRPETLRKTSKSTENPVYQPEAAADGYYEQAQQFYASNWAQESNVDMPWSETDYAVTQPQSNLYEVVLQKTPAFLSEQDLAGYVATDNATLRSHNNMFVPNEDSDDFGWKLADYVTRETSSSLPQRKATLFVQPVLDDLRNEPPYYETVSSYTL